MRVWIAAEPTQRRPLRESVVVAGPFEPAASEARIALLEADAAGQRGKSERQTRDNERRYQTLVRAIAQVIWTHNPSGEMVGDQSSWSAYTGQTREQYEGRGWLDAVHPDDRAQNLVRWVRAVADRCPCELEHRLRRVDGVYRYFSMRAVPVFGDDGQICEWAGIHTDITDRKLSEQAVRDNERRYQTLVRAIAQVIWTHNTAGEMVGDQSSWSAYTGQTREQYEGRGWLNAVHPDDRAQNFVRWVRAVADRCPCELEHRLRGVDGEYRYFSMRAVPVFDDDGQICEWAGIHTDITDRKLSEQSVRDSERRYQTLVQAIAQVIWTLDPKGEMTGNQSSWSAYTGQTREQYEVRGWLNAFHPDDRAKSILRWERAVADRSPCELEHRLRRVDGEYRHFSVRAVPVFGDDGQICEWAGIHTDITERKLSEQSVRDAARRFRELADSMPQIVWTAGADGQIDYYNRRWYEFTGCTDGSIDEETTWAQVIHPDDYQACISLWRRATAVGEPYEVEYRLREKTGAYRWHLRRALPVKDAAGKVTRWFATCTDISSHKRTEEKLRALAESNQSLEEFAAVASHDLQEPLRKIQSYASLLRVHLAAALDQEGKEYLDGVENAATRMRALIDDLLEFSRISSTRQPFVTVDLNTVAREVLQDLQARLRDTSGEVELGILPTVASDPTQMRQLLQNLIGNALKFHRPNVPPRIRVTAEVIDGVCHLAVADNGIGFDEKYLSRVFTIFQRLHGRGVYEGTGIGLAICRKIVERHGGAITARSKPGEGSTFSWTIPMVQKVWGTNAS
jgi:PAS domain S-box-containing protein